MSVAGDIDSINHVGLVVADLESAIARFEQMGFTVTPPSSHVGTTTPDGSSKRLGSRNSCLVFERDYLEVLGRDGPPAEPGDPPNRIDAWLALREGAHILCFGCTSPQTVDERLRGLPVPTSGVVSLQRDVVNPDGVEETARFVRVLVDQQVTQEGLIQAAYHLTPWLIHQERYVHHANGTSRLSAVVMAGPIPAQASRLYEQIVGPGAVPTGNGRSYRLPSGAELRFRSLAEIDREPGYPNVTQPAIVGVELETTRIEHTGQILKEAGLSHWTDGDGLVVSADEAFGLRITFRPQRDGLAPQGEGGE